MLANQISSHGEIFMLIAYRAASQWQWFGTRMGKVMAVLGTSLVNTLCREKGTGEGNDSEEVKASPQLPLKGRMVSSARSSCSGSQAAKTTLLCCSMYMPTHF